MLQQDNFPVNSFYLNFLTAPVNPPEMSASALLALRNTSTIRDEQRWEKVGFRVSIMVVRAYRLTDRLGIVLLKSAVALCDVTLSGLSVIVVGLVMLLRPFLRVGRIAASSTGGAVARSTRRAAQSTEAAATGAMARRAARAELKAGVAQDPLRTQNRVLSLLVLLLGFGVLAVVIWATDPARRQEQVIVPSAPNNPGIVAASVQSNTSENPPPATSVAVLAPPTQIIIPSPVPTVTPLPALLEVRGSLAYVVRENAQTDIWAIPVGSRSPVRLTNSPEDDRDPAWSPDGRRLAYASRQDGNWELYVYDLIEGTTSRMTYDLSFQGAPQWSPDGNWLVYESYQGNNLDIYVMRVDGTQEPLRLTDDAAPDFAPAWSPDGRSIAFVSWRDGNQDIYLFSLDDPREDAIANVTKTPFRHEDFPSWSPDGSLLAFSAVDEGIEKVFVKRALDADSPAQVLERGRAPTWSPDGASLVFAVDSFDSTHLVAGPFSGAGVATEIVPVPRASSDPVWTAAPLPPAIINAGGLPPGITQPLYIEQQNQPAGDPPYRLNVLSDVSAPNAVLSERVNDSFIALREHTADTIGWDFLGQLEDAFWQIDRPPQPGEERRNWLMTGRSFAINRNAIVGFPAPLEVVREDLGVNTVWRVYVRVADNAQSGQLGEPLRHMPWDFASRNQGDVEAYNQGGRLRSEMPSGYYVDLTQLAADFGWERVAAGSDWRANFNSTNYWLFQKRDNLSWLEAMRELYTEGQLGGFVPRQPTTVPGALQDPLAQTEATGSP